LSTRQRGVVPFDPGKTLEVTSVLSAAIEHAKRMRDWVALREAIDLQIKWQKQHVAWWHANVRTDGRPWPENNRPRSAPVIPRAEAEAQTGISHQQVSRWHQRLANEESYKARLFGSAYRVAMDGEMVRGCSGDDEWHTPAEILTLVRAALGSIDLDPASNAEAQKIVKAKHFYTKADSSLDHQWHGHVFLNSPYSQPLITQFVGKLLHEHRAGRVTAAILLTNNSTDAEWFHAAIDAAEAICFTRGRIKFRKWTGEVGAPPQGQTLFYFGPERSRFIQIFSALGSVLMRAEAAESHAEFSEAAE
jgi:phage N-6-adenine-methyltransferase